MRSTRKSLVNPREKTLEAFLKAFGVNDDDKKIYLQSLSEFRDILKTLSRRRLRLKPFKWLVEYEFKLRKV